MKYIHLMLASILLPIQLLANTGKIQGVVYENAGKKEPITGASVYWANTQHGTVTNSLGAFEINNHTGQNKLVISFVGYKTDTVTVTHEMKELTILMEKNINLKEVTVKERRKGIYHSKLNPIQVQRITTTELHKAACCNLSESFETNASVDVIYSDAVTGAKQIQMLGLSGTYVQTLSEAMPSVRGMASSYGLGYVPGPWMESIQISKGTSSVVNGYEAVTGQINVEYKKPDALERFHFNLFLSDELKTEVNMNASIDVGEHASTMILLHAENFNKELDKNGDLFLDMPNVQQINLMNRWEFKGKNNRHRQIGFKALNETRHAGQIGARNDATGNLYGIDINTQRYEVFAKNGYIFHENNSSLGMQLSGIYHNQDAMYGKTNYSGTQYTGYLNLIYEGKILSDLHSYTAGFSVMADRYQQQLLNSSTQTDEIVPGAYLQYTYSLTDQLSVIAGTRADYSTLHGLFFTPRIHTKANLAPWLVARASAGKGYRTAVPLAENTHLLASSRTIYIENNLRQEEAANAGGSLGFFIPVGDREINISLDYYRTWFLNQVVRDMDTDVHAVRFTNLDGRSFSNSFQAEATFEPLRGLTILAAYRINDAWQTINNQLLELPLTHRYKGLLTASYATRLDKWQFDFTTQFNGGGRMPQPDATNPLWAETFDPFTVFNAQITHNYRRWSFYLGGENLSGFKMHQPIIAAAEPWGPNFDGSMIWGPIHGTKIYAGLRYTINRQ
jgi:outer membrane receptor for ferrienterochelin and colicins